MRGRNDETKVPGLGRDDVHRGPEGSATGAARDRTGWPTPPRNAVEAELQQALSEASRRAADEVALRRVWSRLSQIPDLVATPPEEMPSFRRVRWPFVAGASLAGAAAAVAFMLLGGPVGLRKPATAPATPAAVAVVATPRGEPERSTLVAPATVRTASGETLRLSLRGGTEVTVTSDSTLVLDQDERPTVSTGEIRFHVLPQPAGHIFVVRASGYRVVVVGTRFRVRVNGSNAAVGVDEGVVEVWNDEARLARLSAGESWVSPPPDPAASAATREREAPAASGMEKPEAPSGSARTSPPAAELRPRSTRVSHGLRASVGPSAVSASLTSGALTPATPASVDRTLPFSLPADKLAPDVWGVGANGAPAAATPATLTSRAGASAPGATPAAPPTQPMPAADAALASQARAARLAGEPRRALGLYRALAARGGTAGENAEYEVARVLRDGLHQPTEAITAWRSYRGQHPRGLLRVEADISVIETLVAVNDKAAALAEAQDFVRRFPDGERRCEIGALAGDLLRERGDFGSARGEYDGALDSGRCRHDMTDAISFHRAMSLLHEDRTDGVAAVQGYLRAFPAGRFHAAAARLLEEQTRVLAARRL